MKYSSYSRLISSRQSYVALSLPKGLKSFPTASLRARKPVGGEEFRFFGKLRLTIYSRMRLPCIAGLFRLTNPLLYDRFY